MDLPAINLSLIKFIDTKDQWDIYTFLVTLKTPFGVKHVSEVNARIKIHHDGAIMFELRTLRMLIVYFLQSKIDSDAITQEAVCLLQYHEIVQKYEYRSSILYLLENHKDCCVLAEHLLDAIEIQFREIVRHRLGGNHFGLLL